MTYNQNQDRSKLLTGDDLEKLLERKFEAQLNGFGKESEFLDEYFFGGEFSIAAVPKENHWKKAEKKWSAACASGSVGSLSRGNRDACASQNADCFPPLTNSGVLTYQEPHTESITLKHGGYDGGIEIGFDGSWDSSAFLTLQNTLKTAKEQAAELGTDCPIVLGDCPVLVNPAGAKIGSASIAGGLTYLYQFAIYGITFQIHSNPKQGIQPVRVRYGASALIQRDLFDLHFNFVLPFLASLGLQVSAEKISRLDGQVMLDVPTGEFVTLCDHDHAVTRVRTTAIHRKSGKAQTYYVGTEEAGIRLCI
jgi:hypothetical protein